MTDDSFREVPMTEPASKSAAPQTAGALLRQAREASGLHIAALAVSLKVSVKKLEALEADQFDALHDAVFVRALASSVCRTLRIDPALVLDKLPPCVTPVLASEPSVNTPFQTSESFKGLALGARLRHPWALAILALLVGAAIVGYLPELEKAVEGTMATHPDAHHVTAPAVLPVSAASSQAPVLAASSAAVDVAAATVLENVPHEPATSASAAPAASASSAASAASAAGVSKRAASAPVVITPSRFEPIALDAVLAFRARASTWIEVTDARGAVVLRRTLQAGESASASGALPLQSVIGRADAVEVQVRGKRFDLAPVSKENVARFEVK
jgi:cytoskeleton protein RodZ